MSYLLDLNSSMSPSAQWKNHLSQQSALISSINTNTAVSLGAAVAQYAATRMASREISIAVAESGAAQIVAARQNASFIVQNIVGAIVASTECIEGAIANQTQVLSRSIDELGCLLSSKLFAIQDQVQISNLLLQNVAQLMRVPDFQKERQYYIEQGFKHYSNARFDSTLMELALENLLKAEQFEKTDYVLLHRVGMIYLYDAELCDLEKAETYFSRATKFAKVESNPDSVRLFNVLQGKTSSDEDEKESDPVEPCFIAVDSLLQGSIAALAQGKVSDAIILARDALVLDPNSTKTAFQLSRALVLSGAHQEAANVLSKLLPRAPHFALAVANDETMISILEIQVALRNESERQKFELKNKISRFYSMTLKMQAKAESIEKIFNGHIYPFIIGYAGTRRNYNIDSLIINNFCKHKEELNQLRHEICSLHIEAARLQSLSSAQPNYIGNEPELIDLAIENICINRRIGLILFGVMFGIGLGPEEIRELEKLIKSEYDDFVYASEIHHCFTDLFLRVKDPLKKIELLLKIVEFISKVILDNKNYYDERDKRDEIERNKREKEKRVLASQEYYAKAVSEENKQKAKWFGKNFGKAIELYEAAARFGHPEAKAAIRALQK